MPPTVLVYRLLVVSKPCHPSLKKFSKKCFKEIAKFQFQQWIIIGVQAASYYWHPCWRVVSQRGISEPSPLCRFSQSRNNYVLKTV
eukprot:3033764-Amphidinium_carterae.1